MPETKDQIRIHHMLDAARKAIEFTENCNRIDLDNDEMLTLSIVRLLEILGEAAKNVSEQCRKKHSSIQWRQIAGTRDRLIHGYFDVDLNIVWKIVSDDLPVLVIELERALSGK